MSELAVFGVEPYTTLVGANTDSSGNAQQLLFTCYQGFRFTLHRVVCEADGYTAAAPFAAVGAALELYRNDVQIGNLIDFRLSGETLFPSVFSAPFHDSYVLRNGDFVTLKVVSGPGSRIVTARLQGLLHRLPVRMMEEDEIHHEWLRQYEHQHESLSLNLG